MEMVRPTAGDGILKDRRGFSLTELIVVIGIMAVLLAMATLSLQSMQKRNNEEQQVKKLYADLLNTRVRAMQHSRDHFVSLTSNTMYRIYEDTDPWPDGNGMFSAASDSLLSTQNVIPAHTLVMSSATMSVVQFNQKGLLSVGTPTGWIKISPSSGAEYDCVSVDQIKTGMGSMNGTICTVK